MSDTKWLKDSIEKIESKMDKLDEKLDNQNTILSKQAVVLEEHQRRSTASEQNLDLLRKDFKPIQTHVSIVNFVFKAVGFLCMLSGAVLGMIKFLS